MFPGGPTFEHENVVCGFIPRWSPVMGNTLMDQCVVRILYTSWGKLHMIHEGVARITCFIFFPRLLELNSKILTDSSPHLALPICQQCLWSAFSTVVQLQVSSDHICFSFSPSSDQPPIGAHCTPARDTSVSRGGIIPSLSWRIGTRDEARNLILGMRFNGSLTSSSWDLSLVR